MGWWREEIEEVKTKRREILVSEEEGEKNCGGDCLGGFVFLGQLVYAFAITRSPGRTP